MFELFILIISGGFSRIILTNFSVLGLNFTGIYLTVFLKS